MFISLEVTLHFPMTLLQLCKYHKKEAPLHFTSCKSENQFTPINAARVSRRLSERKLLLAVTDKKDVRDTEGRERRGEDR